MKDQNPFKEKLFNHTLPVRDEVWDRIESNLPTKNRRAPLWIFAIGGLIMIGALVTILSINNENTLPENSTEINSTQDFTNNQTGNTQSVDITSNTSSEVNTPEPAKNEISTTQLKQKSSSKTAAGKVTNSNSTTINQNSNELSIEIVSVNSNLNTRSKIEVADLSDMEIGRLETENRTHEMASIMPDPSCYKFSGSNNQPTVSVDIFGGPGFSPGSFEDTGNETSQYIDAREDTETKQYAWSAGARVNLNLKHGLAVRLGLMYEQDGDRFDYTDPSASQSVTTIDSFFDANGNFLYTETNTEIIYGTLIKKIHNRYKRLDLPLLLSYELPMGRSTVMLNAGPVLNLTSTQRGQILDPTLQPKHITPGEADYLEAYKTSLGVSVYLSAGLIIPFSDQISGLVEPRYLYRINPVTVDSYPLKEHRHYAGLNLGIRYHFN